MRLQISFNRYGNDCVDPGWIIKQTTAASFDLKMHSMVLHNYISYLQESKFETRLSVMTGEVLVGEWASE